MRIAIHTWIKTFALVLLAVLTTAGAAASATTREVAPFRYTYQVTALTVTGTHTATTEEGSATTTTRIRLRTVPSRKVNMNWWGRRDAALFNGVGAFSAQFVGAATHASGDPKCARTMDVTSSGSKPLVGLVLTGARDRPVRNPTILVRVGKFPLVTGFPVRRDGTCGKVAKDWWDSATQVFPFRILKRPSFIVRVHKHEEIVDDGPFPLTETIDWTLQMTVRRIRFHPIPCGPSGGC